MQLPDYDNCGTNLVASILSHYGLEAAHQGLPFADALLSSGRYRNIVLMLFDGLSLDALRRHLKDDSFLRSRPMHPLSSIFPSTTTAATTSIVCGLNPAEHGWLGWTLYFEALGASVDVFSNRLQFSKEPAADFHAAERFLPVTAVTRRVSASGRAKGLSISAFGDVVVGSLDELVDQTAGLCREAGPHYLYTYCGEPDHLMHQHGCGDARVTLACRQIDQSVCRLAQSLDEDSLLLITADHGLVDAQPDVIEEHPRLHGMLLRPPSMEPRAAALYVRSAEKKAFPEAFREAFSDHYWLMPGEEAIERGLFGPGPVRAAVPGLVGDYLAIATGAHALFQRREHCAMIGMHAGLTPAEMNVPLIVAGGAQGEA